MEYKEYFKIYSDFTNIMGDYLTYGNSNIIIYMRDFQFAVGRYYLDEVDELGGILLFNIKQGGNLYNNTIINLNNIYHDESDNIYLKKSIDMLNILVNNISVFIEHHISKENINKIIFKYKV